MFFHKVVKYLFIICGVLVVKIASVRAQDITAIDFSGQVIGKVIPDGTAVNLKNQIMGQLSADSFILNSEGDIVGGIVPQGFVISNDHKYFGKVNTDGTVRLPSGRIAGKVLPNGLAVDDAFEVIGNVVSSGIIYDDGGKAVGRLSGNGSFVDFEGKKVGFVSANGYAYKQMPNGYALAGKLLSSKTVVANDGSFAGSVLPGGAVIDFQGTNIGRVHANGYVYAPNGKIVGVTVRRAYAFDNDGNYIGLLSYNGEVIKNTKVVGRLKGNHQIVDLKNKVIGFTVDLDAVALDEKGNYLGYLTPGGKFMRGASVEVGIVAPKGLVVDSQGQKIGQIADKGPVFDALGYLKAEAVSNGHVISFEGSDIGYMKNGLSFDYTGFVIGSVLKPMLVFDAGQNVLGITGIDSDISLMGKKYIVSPFGYLFNSDRVVSGQTSSLSPAYIENGEVYDYVNPNGTLEIKKDESLRLDGNGLVLGSKELLAAQINPSYTVLFDQNKKYRLTQTNFINDPDSKPIAKIVPDGEIVYSPEISSLMPVGGQAGKSMGIVSNIKGELLGYFDQLGEVFYASQNIGKVKGDGLIFNDKNVFVGQVLPFGNVVNNVCEPLGVVGLKGELRNGRDNVLGKTLINGQVISEVGQGLGHIVLKGPLYGFDGSLFGTTNAFGNSLGLTKQSEGCVDWRGRLYDQNGAYKARIAQIYPVMSFESEMIGRVNLKNQFISSKGEVLGFALPDGTVKDLNDEILGLTFLYHFAFDKENNFIGTVDSKGFVHNDKGDVLGQVTYDGVVVSKNKAVGYALYDLFIYDEKNQAIGYLNKNGSVMNFSGNLIGKSDRGFLVSKDGALIGRGYRDYFIRGKNNEAVGELLLSGDVVDIEGSIVGKVSNSGEVRDSNAKLIAQAKPLQYYIIKERQTADWIGKGQSEIAVEPVKIPQAEDNPLPSYSQKVIGVVVSPDGAYLGDLLDNGMVVDPNTGDVIGYNKDGLVFDEDDNLIGTVEMSDKPGEKVSSQIYLPPEAYGTSDKPMNLGPGGGFGPNERYDPARAKLLAEKQLIRQQEVSVGKLSSSINPSSFTGMQANWDNANFTMSSWRVDMSEMILADKPIPAVLARTIMDSGVASNVPVTAIVERNVYAEDGRNIVIPAGSRVMGQFGGATGGNTNGAVRMDITWTRLVRPDGSAFEFTSAQTGDAQGRGGALGILDEQLIKKYTLPVVTTLMSDGLAYVMARGKTTTSSDGNTTSDSRASAADAAREHFLDNMDKIFDEIMQEKTKIDSIVYVPAGTRLIIYPKQDMWIRTAEREKEKAFNGNAENKPDKLIDEQDPTGSRRNAEKEKANSSSSANKEEQSEAVYNGDDSDIQPARNLLPEPTTKKKRRNNIGTTPPPSSSALTQISGSSSDRSNSSEGQLF